MRFMKIVLLEFTFEKEIDSNNVYVFNEFGEEVARFECYARSFETFEEDIWFLMRNGFVDHAINKGEQYAH